MSGLRARLIVTLGSFWLSGSGLGRAFDIDAECVVDADGLPYLPGKHLRGLLRDAMRIAEKDHFAMLPSEDGKRTHLRPGATDALFGRGGRGAGYDGSAGLLEVRDARLSGEIADWLSTHAGDRDALFRRLHQTAIDAERGVAKQSSLRVTEAAIPMHLEGEIALTPWADQVEGEVAIWARDRWRAIVEAALPLIAAVGQGRHHGLGRAFLTLEDIA